MADSTPPSNRPETISMRTRDGVRLDADLYRPPDGEKAGATFPVLLMRQPYGRAIASTVTYAHPIWYAAQGYIVVIQDVRGRGTSEGEWRAFAHEADDGADTVRWAAALPGANGKVGMYGFSYQGATQLLAAAGLRARGDATPLRALAPAMTGYRMDDDWAYEGGAFTLGANLSWGIQVAAETARRAGDETAFQALTRAAAALPLNDPVPSVPDILARYADYGHYMDWVRAAPGADYWASIAPAAKMHGVDLPMLHIGGWYDSFFAGTIAAFRDLAQRCTLPQHLIIGPWTHLDWTGRHPAYSAGPNGVSEIDRLQVRWFDYWLKDAPSWNANEPNVSLFEMGANEWRTYAAWNDRPAFALHLGGDGRAAFLPNSGTLSVSPGSDVCDAIVLDPWRPPPALGGHASAPTGRVDRRAADARADVATFTTEPLDAPLRLAGAVAAELYVGADQPSFDISAVLSEVRSDGAAVNLTQGYRRVTSGESTAPLRIDMRATAALIPAGHALRLSLAPACFPAFPVNDGRGTPPAQAKRIDHAITTLFVRHGTGAPSRLLLPVVGEK